MCQMKTPTHTRHHYSIFVGTALDIIHCQLPKLNLKTSLNRQAILWSCRDQKKRPHFAKLCSWNESFGTQPVADPRAHTLVCLISLKPTTLSCSPLIITSEPLSSHFLFSFMFIKASPSSPPSFLTLSPSLSPPSTVAFVAVLSSVEDTYLFALFFSLLILSYSVSWR